MSEPSGKTDSSIESKVPGEQPLRGDYIQELQNKNVQENNIAVTDYSLSPVITVTKEESTFTKGDLKVQKVIVSEDISDETSNTNRKLTTTESTSPTEVQTTIHSEVSSVTINTEGDTQTSTGDQKVVYKVTKIPKLKFKQAVDKIKNEEEMKKEGKDEVELGLKITETVPGLKDEKNLLKQLSRSESIQQDSPKVDDEFDRIYDEIFENGPPSGNFPSPEKIEDTDKLETKFDEIIHAYDEQKAQANAEKVKSKIPLLKRKSEHDIYAPGQTLRKNSLNKRNSIDDTKCKLPVPLIKEKQNVELVSSQKQKTVSAQKVTVFEIDNTITSKPVTTVSHQKDGEINIMHKTEFSSTSEVYKSKIPTHLKEIAAVEKASDIQSSEITRQFSIEKRNEYNIIVEKDTGNKERTTETETKTNIVTKVDDKNLKPINDSPQVEKPVDATTSNNLDKLEKVPNINDNNKKDITQNIIAEKGTGNREQIPETEAKTHIVTKVNHKNIKPINDSPQNEKPVDAKDSNKLDKLEKVPNTNDNNKKDITQNIIAEKYTGNREQISETETKTHIVTKVDVKNLKPINNSPQIDKPIDATKSNNLNKLEKVPNINDNNKKDITQNIIAEKGTGNREQIPETEAKTHIVTKVDDKNLKPINNSPQIDKPIDATKSNNLNKLEKVPNTNDNIKKDITPNIIAEKDTGNRDQITGTEAKTHIVTKVDVINLKPINDLPQIEKPLDSTNPNNVDKLEKVLNINDNNKKDITKNIIGEKDTGNREQISETETKTHIVTKVDVKNLKPINNSPQIDKPIDATKSNNLNKLEKVPNINDNNKKDITQNIIAEKGTGNREQIPETEAKTHIVTKVDDKNLKPINNSPQIDKPIDATKSNNLNKLEKVPNTNDNIKKDITPNIIAEKDTGNRDQITGTEAKTHIVTKVDVINLKPINDLPQIEKPLDSTNPNNVDKLEKVLNINDNNKKDITKNIIGEKDTGNRDQITEIEAKTHIVTKVDVKNVKPINDSPQNEIPLDATNSNNLDKLEKVPNTNDNNKKDITQNIIGEKDTGNRDQITEIEAKTHIVTKLDVQNLKLINDLPQNEKPLDATNFNNDFQEKNNHSENNFSKIEVQKINVNETNSSVSIIQEVKEIVEIVSNSDMKDIQHDQQDKVRDNITNIPKDILHISRSDVCLKTNSVHNNSLQEIIYDDSKTKLSGESIKRNDVIDMNRENATIITEQISYKIQSNASEDLSRNNNEINSNNLSQEYTINKFPSISEHISQKIITEVNNNEIKTEDIKVSKAIEDIAIRNNKVNSSENNGKDVNELEEEDVIILKGKVNRMISRLDSKEYKVNKCQLDDVPQEESVVSKIALFEQSKSIDTTQKASITKNKLEDEINVDKPKIVDEVLKIEKGSLPSDSKFSYNTFLDYKETIKNSVSVKENKIQATSQAKSMSKFDKIFKTNINLNKFNKTNENAVRSSEDEVFFKNEKANRNIINEYKINKEIDLDMRRAKSLAELNYDGVQGRVRQMVVRMNSIDKMALERREQNEVKRRTRHGSVSERIALFEQDANEQSVHLMKKITPIRMESVSTTTSSSKQEEFAPALTEEELTKRITELTQARATYGHYDNMTYVELSDGGRLPSLVVGTALLDPPLTKPIIKAAIDLGYRAIDTAYVYGNEQAIGEAIREKIEDGTVKREELFVLAKLWSTNHRHDLVSRACKQSLEVMGLDYFDLYLIHNPMSFKEGPNPFPKIANVLQYSEHDYLEAWFGIESLIKQGLVKRGGVSNFNSVQVERVLDKGKIKPVVNQVECHPYLSQARLQDYLSSRGVALSCFGCLGSSGTPRALRSSLPPVIQDPLVRTMAAGLGVTPAQLLISYQVSLGRSVVVKSSSAEHLWDDLCALELRLAPAHAAGLAALNRNKRTFTFEGMGDTHKNYPFKIPF